MDWEFPSEVMEDIPVIPTRRIPWLKIITGIGGIGIATGGTAYAIENGNKGAVLTQLADEKYKVGVEKTKYWGTTEGKIEHVSEVNKLIKEMIKRLPPRKKTKEK